VPDGKDHFHIQDFPFQPTEDVLKKAANQWNRLSSPLHVLSYNPNIGVLLEAADEETAIAVNARKKI